MKITKQRFGYVLDLGVAAIIFDQAVMQNGATPDLKLIKGDFIRGFIPNQNIKEFEQKFIEAGGVIE